ncbi:MAG: Zn-ribbon domain-containing OB-fold protein [Myxococcales bacterium]
MKELIDAQTKEALELYGDAAGEEFRRRLASQRLCSTRCASCGRIAFPPRGFCPHCHAHGVEWVELPRRARLYAFTQQQRGLRFLAPDVLGLVEVAGVGHFLSRIDAPFESLSIDQELEVSFTEIAPGLWVHQYRPV